MNNEEIIKSFCSNANYIMIKHNNETEKIDELFSTNTIDLNINEIYRSIGNKNFDTIFEIDFSETYNKKKYNILQIAQKTLESARLIDMIYPNMFTWVFNGYSVIGYFLIPCSKLSSQGTINRYGGIYNFIRILRRHLFNLIKIHNNLPPDYNFYNLSDTIKEEILSVGSINNVTGLYSKFINIKDSYIKLIKDGKNKHFTYKKFKNTDMKFWAREINPDFIKETKRITIDKPLKLTYDVSKYYPAPIKRLMKLKHKGNYNRFLLARFLLSVHSPKDAKFIYYSTLGKEELEHVKNGNCSLQWNFIVNNLERYKCPTMKELKNFIKEDDEKLSHPLERIQEILNKESEVENES